MPTIKYKGVEIHFDTLDEAIAAADRISGGVGTNNGHGGNGGDGRWTVSRFKDYVGRLSQIQVRMLQELVKSPHGRTAKDLASTLGLDTSKAFGPILGAMSRHAKAAGISHDDVMRSDRVMVGRDTILEFRATPAFIKVAAEGGWKAGD